MWSAAWLLQVKHVPIQAPVASNDITVTVNPIIIPTFNPITLLCRNSTPPTLPNTSLNGINGTWNPATISTSVNGITDYIFTPDNGECAIPATMTIQVEGPEITEVQTFTSTDGLPNGQAIIIASGNALPLSYQIDGTTWQTSNIFTNLLPGNYTASVKDANGCTVGNEFTITNTVIGKVEFIAGNTQSCINIPFNIPVLAYDFTDISSFTIQMTFDTSAINFNNISQQNILLNNGSSLH